MSATTATSRPLAAYVHVPFCVHRCGYCDFTVVAGRDDLIAGYLAALARELSTELGEPQPVQTLFLGGGTPTYLPPPALQRLLELLAQWCPLLPGGEYSVEANPEGFDRTRMELLQAAGVNRISLGVQSFHEPTLQVLERSHRPEQVGEVVRHLRETGFENIAIDLIYGVPGQTVAHWQETLHATLDLAPRHVSTYGLTFEKGTNYWGRLLRGELRRTDEELEREMYALAMHLLPAHGIEQYELSNFGLPGFACRHNQVYWRQEPYWGFGPGAAGFVGQVRSLRHKSVTTWIQRTLSHQSAIMEREELTPEMFAREGVMLGLRQIAGIDLARFLARHGVAVRELAPRAYERFLTQGWLEATPTHVRLTPEGRYVADTVMAEFLVPE